MSRSWYSASSCSGSATQQMCYSQQQCQQATYFAIYAFLALFCAWHTSFLAWIQSKRRKQLISAQLNLRLIAQQYRQFLTISLKSCLYQLSAQSCKWSCCSTSTSLVKTSSLARLGRLNLSLASLAFIRPWPRHIQHSSSLAMHHCQLDSASKNWLRMPQQQCNRARQSCIASLSRHRLLSV